MTIYVDSNKTGGTDAGTSWTNAYLTLQQALDDAGALTTPIFVHVGASNPHAETTAASVTLSSTASDTDIALLHIYGVDQNNSDVLVPNPSTTITIEATGVGNDIIINCASVWEGIWFKAADDFETRSGNKHQVFKSCRFEGGDNWLCSNADSRTRFENCIITIQTLQPLGACDWIGGSITTVGSPEAYLFNPNSSATCYLRGVDLSGVAPTAGVILGGGSAYSNFEFVGCDMPASWTAISHSTWLEQGMRRHFFQCDDSSQWDRSESYESGGDVKTDTGVYLTTGGWSDETHNSTGVPLSHIMTPSSRIQDGNPVPSFPLIQYIDTTGSTTFTVELIDDFQTALQDDEVWMELLWLGTSGQIRQDFSSSRVASPDTPANLAAGTGAGNWTGEPTSSRSVKLALTETVNVIGMVQITVYLAKYEVNGADGNPGAALYVAPKVTVS